MKKIRLILVSLSISITTIAQQNPIQLLPQFSIGQPIGAFSQETFNTKNGFGGGLHVEKQNLWKVFGLGLYGGYHSYTTDFLTAFPSQVNDPNFAARVLFQGNNLNWKSLQLALGPTINLNLSNKLQLQGFTKAGLAKVNYPAYRYFVDVSSPINEQFTLYESNTPNETQSNFNFMMVSGLRFNYNISKSVGLSLGANFSHIKGLTSTFTSKDILINGEETSSILYEKLLSTPEVSKTCQCNVNSINGTVGLVFSIGNKAMPTKIKEPTVQTQPEVIETYNCTKIVYESPGYNEHIVLSEKQSFSFEWSDENSQLSKIDKTYQLHFYTRENGAYKEIEKSTMSAKNKFKKNINASLPYPDNALYWQIVAVDKNERAFCPQQAKMMRLLVFQDKTEAIKKLPECLLIDESKTKPVILKN